MRAEITEYEARLIREHGDKAIGHESTTGFHLRKILNRAGWNFKRMNPSRHGLTDCKVGMWDHKRKVILWHGNYQIEDAASAFNRDGRVVFNRVAAV